MGMSASQARLLSLTSRLHDIELQAQSIESQKIALATQRDDAFEEYCNALDAKAFKINVGSVSNSSLINANFNSLCGYYQGKSRNYALVDNKSGLVLVDDETKKTFMQYGTDKYAFAFAMMGVLPENNEYLEFANANPEESLMTTDETAVYNTLISEESSKATLLKNKHAIWEEAVNNGDKDKISESYRNFREELMKQAANAIFTQIATACGIDNREFDINEFNHYTRLWDAIDKCGGCTVIDKMYTTGDEGTAWFKNNVESGLVSIMIYGDNSNKNEWTETSFNTSYNNNFLQEVEDKTNQKKAEAKYEHELDLINQKDKEFDTTLNKLETERTSINTEMDAIKKVKDENIERTYNIFS